MPLELGRQSVSRFIRNQRRTWQHLTSINSVGYFENDQIDCLTTIVRTLRQPSGEYQVCYRSGLTYYHYFARFIPYHMINQYSPEMIHILIRSNVDILNYVNLENLSINTWRVAVQHNINNIRRVPERTRINLAFYLIVIGNYTVYQFQNLLSYSNFTLLINMFGQHYRTEMMQNNTFRFDRIIRHIPIQPLALIILEYVYI
jgi:hypothetical protein